jgi:acyl carrier protein
VADVRQHAALQLPAYMVPTHLVVLDEFPLTNSGKIDQAALPAPEALPDLDTYRSPTTVLEAVLVDMVSELLKNDAVGVDDSFFDLGGNSLQAMRLITQLRDELAVDADVTAIFLAPTPGQLTLHLREVHGIEDAPLDDADLDVPDHTLVD